MRDDALMGALVASWMVFGACFMGYLFKAEEVNKEMKQLKEDKQEVIGKYEHLTLQFGNVYEDNKKLQAEGSKLHNTVSILAKDLSSEWHVADAVITAYSPLDDQNGLNADEEGDTTATGMKVGYGRFAVDPERIPYGSRILIVYGDGSTEEGIAADTGAALRKDSNLHIDVYRDTFGQAMKFGVCDAVVIWQAPRD